MCLIKDIKCTLIWYVYLFVILVCFKRERAGLLDTIKLQEISQEFNVIHFHINLHKNSYLLILQKSLWLIQKHIDVVPLVPQHMCLTRKIIPLRTPTDSMFWPNIKSKILIIYLFLIFLVLYLLNLIIFMFWVANVLIVLNFTCWLGRYLFLFLVSYILWEHYSHNG